MAIVLKYGSPGSILGTSYAAGVGHRQNEEKDDNLRVWQQQQQMRFQAGLQGQSQAFQTVQAGLSRQQAKDLQAEAYIQQGTQQAAERTFRSTEAGLQRTFQEGQQKNLLGAQSKERAEDRQQRMLHDFDVQALEGLRRGQLELPPAAQKRIDQLDAGLVDAMKLSPSEQEEFYKKYQEEKRSLLRTAQPKKEQSYDERLQGALQRIPEQHRNEPWQLDDQNKLSLPTGYKMSDPAGEQAKQMQQYQKDNAAYMKERKAEAQRLADANIPAKGTAAKPWTDYLDSATENLTKAGMAAPQMPGQQPSATPVGAPAAPAVAPPTQAAAQPAVTQPVSAPAGAPPAPAVTPVARPPQQAQVQPPAARGAPAPGTLRPGQGFDLENLPPSLSSVHPNSRQAWIENMPRSLNELPKNLRDKYAKAWPTPASPEEARTLAPGTIFLTPDGRINSIPF